MQAKFYKQVIEAGWSIDSIVRASGQTETKVRENLRDYHLYEMACILPKSFSEGGENIFKSSGRSIQQKVENLPEVANAK